MTGDGDMSVVEFAGEPVTVLWRRSARARRLQMRAHPEGVIMVMPVHGEMAEAERFLRQHLRWAVRHMHALRLARGRVPPAHDGALLPFRGGQVRLSIRPAPGNVDSVLLHGDRLVVLCRTPEARHAVLRCLNEWYLDQAAAVANALLAKWMERIGVQPSTVRLRDLSSRWGSCSSRGAVSLNWRLILAPDEVFEYVVVHELCHRRRLGHGAAFWGLLREMLPEAEASRGWLRENQAWMMGFLREDTA